MIQSFIESWPLFHESYLVGWLSLVLLSMVGVIVVARDQIFMGAAVSQASTLGVAVALWVLDLPQFHETDAAVRDNVLAACSVAFAVLASILTSRGNSSGPDTHETITGWVFLASASLSVLIVSYSPHGMEEVHRLMSSGILGATAREVRLFAVTTVLVGGFLFVVRRRALLVLTDEEMARAVGLHPAAWNLGLACLLGLVVGLSLRCVGLLYTFGGLVLPCIAARHLCRRVLPMLLVGPILGLATGVVAFVLANHWNQPPGQMTVALLCLVVAGSSLARRLRRAG